MPCLAASCAVVSSPRSASKATFALNSAEYRFRLPVIRVRPSRRRTELNHLSEVRGPPPPRVVHLACAATGRTTGCRSPASVSASAQDRCAEHGGVEQEEAARDAGPAVQDM